MNGFEFLGRQIRVGLGNDKFTPESTQKVLASNSFRSQNQQGSSFSGTGGRGTHAGGHSNFDRASGRDADRTGGASALDDTDVGGGVNYTNYSRADLMGKLARTHAPEEKMAPKPKAAPKVEEAAPSRCILIKNMFDPATYVFPITNARLTNSCSRETEPGWQKELELDVRDKAEEEWGHVVHLSLSMDSNIGEVYIKFENIRGGIAAIRGLNGRYFAGRVLSAQFVVEAIYNINFPKAAKF